MSFTAKSIVLDIADNWGEASFAGLRSLDMKLLSTLVDIVIGDISATYGSEASGDFLVSNAFVTGLSKTGSHTGTSWIGSPTSSLRIICVFVSPQTFDEVVINNYHTIGADTNRGIQNIKITISDDAISDTTYNAAVANSTVVYDSTFNQHTASDVQDDQILTLIEPIGVDAEPIQIALGITGAPAPGVTAVPIQVALGIAGGPVEAVTAVPIQVTLGITGSPFGVNAVPIQVTIGASGTPAPTVPAEPIQVGVILDSDLPTLTVNAPPIQIGITLDADEPVIFSRAGASIFYIFTLTGAADSVDDIEIPIANFQARRRDGDPTFLQVTVPDADSNLAAILARPNGTMKVDMAFEFQGEFIRRDTIVEALLEHPDPVNGPVSQSIILSGHKTESFGSQAITVPASNASIRTVSQGKLSYRLAVPDVNMRPGDTVTIQTDTFVPALLTYFISVDRQIMTVSE